MAEDTTRRRRRRRRPRKVEEVENEIETTEDEEDEVEDEGNEELAAPKRPTRRRRRSRKSEPEESEDEEEEDEEVEEVETEDEDEEVVEKPAPSRRRRARKSEPEPEPESEESEDEEEEDEEDEEDEEEVQPSRERLEGKLPDSLSTILSASMLMSMLEAMREGEKLVIHRTTDDTWQIGMSAKIEMIKRENSYVGPPRLGGSDYWDEVLSQPFKDWQEEWSSLSNEEKIKKVKKAGVDWEEHENEKINLMRASAAYRRHLGVDKYKEKYRGDEGRKLRRQIRA